MMHRFVQYSLISICENQYSKMAHSAETKIVYQSHSNCDIKCYSSCRHFAPGSTRVGIMNK